MPELPLAGLLRCSTGREAIIMRPQRTSFVGCGQVRVCEMRTPLQRCLDLIGKPELPLMVQAVDVVAGRLTFVAVTDREAFVERIVSKNVLAFSIDKELVRPMPQRRYAWLSMPIWVLMIPSSCDAGVLALLQRLWSSEPWTGIQILQEDGPDAAGEPYILRSDLHSYFHNLALDVVCSCN